MFCEKCGHRLSENSNQCPNCTGNVQRAAIEAEVINDIPVAEVADQAEKISTYLPFAIFSTVCCCLPFGIVATVYAAKTSALLSVDKLDEAKIYSAKAKFWVWLAFGCGLLVGLLQIIFQILIVAGAAMAGA